MDDMLLVDSLGRFLIALVGIAAAYWGVTRAYTSVSINRGFTHDTSARNRFHLIDFLALFVMLQLPLLLFFSDSEIRPQSRPGYVVWGVLYALVYVGIWWWGVGALSQLQISSTLRRAVFLAILQPLGLCLTAAGVVGVLSAAGALIAAPWPRVLAWGGGVVAWGILLRGFAAACQWIRRGSPLLQTATGGVEVLTAQTPEGEVWN